MKPIIKAYAFGLIVALGSSATAQEQLTIMPQTLSNPDNEPALTWPLVLPQFLIECSVVSVGHRQNPS